MTNSALVSCGVEPNREGFIQSRVSRTQNCPQRISSSLCLFSSPLHIWKPPHRKFEHLAATVTVAVGLPPSGRRWQQGVLSARYGGETITDG